MHHGQQLERKVGTWRWFGLGLQCFVLRSCCQEFYSRFVVYTECLHFQDKKNQKALRPPSVCCVERWTITDATQCLIAKLLFTSNVAILWGTKITLSAGANKEGLMADVCLSCPDLFKLTACILRLFNGKQVQFSFAISWTWICNC